MYKSEIRDSLIANLLERVEKNNYSKYLRSLHITSARHLKNSAINFDFPVTALIGPNGGGKSTVLALAACAHKGAIPRTFFFVSIEGDNVSTVATYEFTYIDKNIESKGILKQALSIGKNSLGVSGRSFERSHKYFGSHRILPPNESQFFMRKRLSGRGNAAIRDRKVLDSNETRIHAEKILGKSLRDFSLLEITFSKLTKVRRKPGREILQYEPNGVLGQSGTFYYRKPSIDEAIDDNEGKLDVDSPLVYKKVVGKQLLFICSSSAGHTYSEFNFGAGEASVLRMVAEIEQLPEQSLVLIEEVENGLHPIAVTRLVEYLIEVAERKRLQVIFTTHSEYALMPLPSEGIWASVNGELIRGHLTIESLRAITGKFDKQLAIFCEDNFARVWLEAIFRIATAEHFPLFGFYHLDGDGTAVKIHKSHNLDPAVDTKSVCFIDGDSQQKSDEGNLVFRLPGESPERYVFDGVYIVMSSKIALLTAGVQLPLSEQNRVRDIVESISVTNRDPHLLFSQIGEQLGLVSEEVVRGAFFAIWIDQNMDYIEKIKLIISPLIELTVTQGRK
jgi:predicted ATPase